MICVHTRKAGNIDMYNELQRRKNDGSIYPQKKNHGQCGREGPKRQTFDREIRRRIVYGLGTIPFEDAPAIICDMRNHVATVVSWLLGIDIMINNRVLCT